MEYCDEIWQHYVNVWGRQPVQKKLNKGPVAELPKAFAILEFAPTKARTMWTYATCCMSQPLDDSPLEIHLFSPTSADSHVELLTALAHYNRTGNALGLGHTVYFGRPWMPGSKCDYGLISLPYLDGPLLECHKLSSGDRTVRFLWLIPITKEERDFKKESGVESLERRFEEAKFNYLDPLRKSVVCGGGKGDAPFFESD